MGRKQITGLGIAVVLIAAYFGIQLYASNLAAKKVDEAIAKIAAVADIDYKSVSVDLIGWKVRISDVVVSSAATAEKTKISEIIIRDFDDKSDVPAFMSLSCRGIELNVDSMKEGAKRFKELGYAGTLSCNFDIDYRIDREKKELTIKKLAAGIKDAGEFDLRLHFGNVDIDPQQALGLLFTYPQITVYDAKFSYRDESLVPRIIDHAAQAGNRERKDFKAAMLQNFDKEIEKEKDEFTRSALTEVKRFLDHPKEFSISAAPEKPLPLGRIMRVKDPKDLVKLLNIRIQS